MTYSPAHRLRNQDRTEMRQQAQYDWNHGGWTTRARAKKVILLLDMVKELKQENRALRKLLHLEPPTA